MTEILRPYQERGFNGVNEHRDRGVRRVCLVAPTGAGKTVLARAFCSRELERGGSVLFVVHRRELVKQTALRFRDAFGFSEVGMVLADEDRSPHSRIQVGTVQTFLKRNIRPDASLVIFDEAHHYAAKDWSGLLHHYSGAFLLGLTATPERQDGKPLDDLFDELVVAAKYSELLRDRFLVPCVIYRPEMELGADLAQDPVKAYELHAEGSQAFVFAGNVEIAEALAKRFTEAGILAACIEANTPKLKRDQYLADFERGEIRVITNVNTMTEGVDIPQARTVILARAFRHVGAFLQAGGRVLRPDPRDLALRPAKPTWKPRAILIDLVGATYQKDFGSPTDDRDYSLSGEGIKPAANVQPLTTCASCLKTFNSRPGGCPFCGHITPPKPREMPEIFNMELREVWDGEKTPEDAKAKEYARLRAEGQKRGWKLEFVQKEYRRLFGETPVIHDATEEEKAEYFEKWRDEGERLGKKAGYCKIRFKEMFGHWPRGSAA